MRKTLLICDRCGEDYSNETAAVENFFVKVGGINYVEDNVVSGKDFCHACIAHVRRAIVSAVAPPAREG